MRTRQQNQRLKIYRGYKRNSTRNFAAPCPKHSRLLARPATGLPSKPLLDLGGQPLVQRTHAAAERGGYEVLVAVDDPRVAASVQSFGGRYVMTPADLPSGTDRAAYVSSDQGWPDGDVVINLQVDEPFFPSEHFRKLVEPLHADATLAVSTLACPIRDHAEVLNEHCVKVVCATNGNALYFSRAPIPWVRGQMQAEQSKAGYLRHVGVYAYRVGALKGLAALEPTPAERAESLEQLRALEHSLAIRVVVVDEAPPPGIDVEADLELARQHLARRGSAAQP